MEYNGGCVVAMTGKGCVAIAADRRFGVQQQTLALNMQKVFEVGRGTYLGFGGLASDVQTMIERVRFRTNLFKLREERDIKPTSLANLVSAMLYERRFGPYFVEPVIAGLEGPEHKPFICAMDLIGAQELPLDFACAGTCKESLMGMCESLWKPDMAPEELFETISQATISSVDRDCLSGWGVVVHLITAEGVTTRTLMTRQD